MATMSAILCLATAIFFEARAEPLEGQIMVAETIMNRVEDTRYPNDVCDVVFERKAFSFTHDGKSDNIWKYNTYHDKIAQAVALEVAKQVMELDYSISAATHYHATNVKPYWAKHYDYERVIGNHVFYVNNTPHK